ncbi:MAG: TrbI F-type domain-containing protein [Legionellales bacterium]|jgi:hypothetical protein
MQNLLFKYKLSWWQSALIMFFMLLVYHFVQPKSPRLGMANIQEISQNFLHHLAAQNLTKEQQTKHLEIFGRALNDELNRLSKEVILFESSEVVTPLADYTDELKQSIFKAPHQD